MSNVAARRKAPRPRPAVDSLLESKPKGFDSAHYPRAGEFSLFDMPALIRQCIDALKAKGIGRVDLHHLVVVNGKLQLHIKYFRALDRVGECVGMGYNDGIGHYSCFVLPVNDAIDIAWSQEQGRAL